MTREIFLKPTQLYQKHSILGLKTVSITIRKDQVDWLKSMAEVTGESMETFIDGNIVAYTDRGMIGAVHGYSYA